MTNKGIAVHINGQEILIDPSDKTTRLVDYLHEELDLTGTKESCGIGQCGACKVIVQEDPNGPFIPVLACYARMNTLDQLHVTTIEGLSTNGLTKLQESFLQEFSFQCGFCTPGFVMAGEVFLDELKRSNCKKDEVESKILQNIQGHLCRCTGYTRYYEALKKIAGSIIVNKIIRENDEIPKVYFKIIKQSGNDLEEKTLIGHFNQVDASIYFDNYLDFNTFHANFEFKASQIRTGERIRDLNLCKFLFNDSDERSVIKFSLYEVIPLDKVSFYKISFDNPIPVKILGLLSYKKAKIKVITDCLITILDNNKIKVTSISPISISISDLLLPLIEFSSEFKLRISNDISVYIDGVFDYEII